MHLSAVEAGLDGAREPLGAGLSALAAFLTGARCSAHRIPASWQHARLLWPGGSSGFATNHPRATPSMLSRCHSVLMPDASTAGAAGMEVASRAPALVAGLARAAAVGSTSIARTSLEMLSKLCLFSSQGYCLALQVSCGSPLMVVACGVQLAGFLHCHCPLHARRCTSSGKTTDACLIAPRMLLLQTLLGEGVEPAALGLGPPQGSLELDEDGPDSPRTPLASPFKTAAAAAFSNEAGSSAVQPGPTGGQAATAKPPPPPPPPPSLPGIRQGFAPPPPPRLPGTRLALPPPPKQGMPALAAPDVRAGAASETAVELNREQDAASPPPTAEGNKQPPVSATAEAAAASRAAQVAAALEAEEAAMRVAACNSAQHQQHPSIDDGAAVAAQPSPVPSPQKTSHASPQGVPRPAGDGQEPAEAQLHDGAALHGSGGSKPSPDYCNMIMAMLQVCHTLLWRIIPLMHDASAANKSNLPSVQMPVQTLNQDMLNAY